MYHEDQTPPTHLLAIDPGANSGWAYFRGGHLKHSGVADGSMWASLSSVLRAQVLPLMEGHSGAAVCVIEEGWTNGTKGALTLGRRRGIAQAAAESIGFSKFEYVSASTWQNRFFGPLRKRDTKKLSTGYVKTAYPHLGGISHDQSDAICLGDCWLGRRDLP